MGSNVCVGAQRSRMSSIRDQVPWRVEVGGEEIYLCTQRMDVSVMDLKQWTHWLGLRQAHYRWPTLCWALYLYLCCLIFSCVSMKWIILSLFCRLGSQSSESGVACLMPQNQEVGCLRKQLFSENTGFLLQRGCGGHRGPTKTSGWRSEWERGAWKLIGWPRKG